MDKFIGFDIDHKHTGQWVERSAYETALTQILQPAPAGISNNSAVAPRACRNRFSMFVR